MINTRVTFQLLMLCGQTQIHLTSELFGVSRVRTSFLLRRHEVAFEEMVPLNHFVPEGPSSPEKQEGTPQVLAATRRMAGHPMFPGGFHQLTWVVSPRCSARLPHLMPQAVTVPRDKKPPQEGWHSLHSECSWEGLPPPLGPHIEHHECSKDIKLA